MATFLLNFPYFDQRWKIEDSNKSKKNCGDLLNIICKFIWAKQKLGVRCTLIWFQTINCTRQITRANTIFQTAVFLRTILSPTITVDRLWIVLGSVRLLNNSIFKEYSQTIYLTTESHLAVTAFSSKWFCTKNSRLCYCWPVIVWLLVGTLEKGNGSFTKILRLFAILWLIYSKRYSVVWISFWCTIYLFLAI